MATEKTVRRSVSLPLRIARKVNSLARSRRTSANRVLLDLIERGMESQDNEKDRFFALADALAASKDAEEQKRLKAELRRMTFGE